MNLFSNVLPMVVCVAGAQILAGSSARADIAQGLIGHWTFDQTSGTTAADTSGQNHNGVISNLNGDNPGWTTGQIGGALTFRGPDGGDAVIVSGFPTLSNTFSVSAWVWADPRDGTWPESAIVRSAGTSGGPLGLVIRLKNRDQAFGPLGDTTVDVAGAVMLNETVGFPVSTWQQVGLVADGSRIHLYRNGGEVGSTNYTAPLAPPITSDIGIGVAPDDSGAPGNAYWQGKIDDVGIWNVALTSSQMASVFNAGLAGKDLSQADAYQNSPPTISTQPTSITRFVGETASFSVQAAGTGVLSYQWKLSGNPVNGATNATYTIGSVTEADGGDYVVVVSNANGSKESQAVTLTVQKVTIATGLIGYWNFDEKQGDSLADASTNKNNGTLNNFPGDNSQWVAGQIGGALSLGGSDLQEYVAIPDYPKPTSTLTVALWVYADALGSWASFAKNWGSTDAGQFHFGLFSDGVHENIFIKQADGKTPSASDPDPFPTNAWQHVAFVCDGTAVRLYRNGVEVASTTYNGTLVTPPMNCIGLGVKIANDCTEPDGGAPGWFQGKMDDLGIWNRGLNPGEILAIYQAGNKGKGLLEADTAQAFPPTIVSQLTNVTVLEGVRLNLTVSANGTPPLSYQWFKDGQSLLAGTNSTLALGPATTAANGSYKVTISNSSGNTTSSNILVSVQSRPAATLVSEWKFEGNLKDTSGHGNDGTAGGTVDYVPGVSGQAVRLAAANPVVNSAANNLPAAGTDSWSLNLWLKLAVPPKSLAYLAGFGPIQDEGAGTPRAIIAFGGPQNNNLLVWGSNRDTPSDTPYPVGRWAMVTATYDGTDGTTSLYLDGQLIAQNTEARVDIPDGENRISLAPTSNWNVDTAGDFDEFTVWNGVLNLAQIQDLYSVGQLNVTLQASLSGSNLTISWPATATGFVLESTDQLPGGTWTAVPGVTGNGITIPIGPGAKYFRLRQ